MLALASSKTMIAVFVSPRYRFRYAFSVRAKTFQSTCRKSSPGVYARYSANSWLKPKSGERCRPAMNPSTTVLAIRSRLEISARTAGSRKRFVTSTGTTGCFYDWVSSAGRRFPFKQFPQQIVRGQAVRFSMEIQEHAMPHHGNDQGANIFVGYMESAVHQSTSFAG